MPARRRSTTAIQQLDKVTQQNTSAAEEMSSTSEELASQAEQLQAAISYFRVDETLRSADLHHEAAGKKTKSLRAAVLAAAPHMTRKAGGRANGGFDLDLQDGDDELDAEFTRRGGRLRRLTGTAIQMPEVSPGIAA